MAKEKEAKEVIYESECDCGSKKQGGAVSGGIYGLAFIGALIYFLQHATTFWIGLLGVLKAIIWPALLVYRLLEFFKM